ncbi:MAG: hypothetical protein EOO13_12375 [Chitinophagaceae bacterium]|nr:MAG: hypothetical protein EOO13_12375 [Chitinophagaceae bacterium]
MKCSTICLSALTCLLFASCGDDDSTPASQENWYKARPPQKINIQNSGGAGSADKSPQVQAVPFDFGLSAALGAGALAAVKLARRKKERKTGA